MPTDTALMAELLRAISGLAHELSDNGTSLTDVNRIDLVKNAEKLAIAAREPAENLYFQATQTAQNSSIRTAINMGVFEAVPSRGMGVTVAELAQELKVNEHLLARILRALTSAHIFDETSPSSYTHNALSSVFLIPANRDMFKQMYDFLGLGVYTMPQFLKSKNHQNPIDYNDGAFQYGHRTTLGPFEYVKADPERMKTYNSAMQSLATIGDAAKSAGSFPYGLVMGEGEIVDTDVMIVDVGGGRGQVLRAITQVFPNLKGRMILQDQRDVIEDAKASGLPSFIEPMAASFFELQPVKGALIYHFRRIFHDWSNNVSLQILRNTKQAMSSRSRILITDTVIPEINTPRHVALQDINMMSFGGMERTQLQWETLLQEAGLVITKFWVQDGDLQNTIEARLPSKEGTSRKSST